MGYEFAFEISFHNVKLPFVGFHADVLVKSADALAHQFVVGQEVVDLGGKSGHFGHQNGSKGVDVLDAGEFF